MRHGVCDGDVREPEWWVGSVGIGCPEWEVVSQTVVGSVPVLRVVEQLYNSM